ncbi:putative DNA-directed RNA polymerase subunit [Triangularia setosa]|uniref:DNA-directed RNA polymerase subunit n=1 Tax=Triangularia setosa TaxID=2587417 RepID=A0AAN6WHQ9_9PEZI|nr:putative DNA-directed RNA polymerase subunit [Podospora setosa]
MSAIGSLVFCTDCGNLLPASQGNVKNLLICDCCGAEHRDQPWKAVTTKTKPSDFPSALRQKLSIVQTVKRHEVQTERVDPNMDCHKCGRRGIRYSEVQQRSADEGSTIIYNCECGEKWSTNN